MAKIQPVIIPLKGTATILKITVSSFRMEDTTATFYYSLHAEEEQTMQMPLPLQDDITDQRFETIITVTERMLMEGNLTMNEQEFSQWGADNNYCIQWAASKLGLVIVD